MPFDQVYWHCMNAGWLEIGSNSTLKTQLVWIGARHNLMKMLGGGPFLTLGRARVATAEAVREPESNLLQVCRWASTWPHSAPNAFFSVETIKFFLQNLPVKRSENRPLFCEDGQKFAGYFLGPPCISEIIWRVLSSLFQAIIFAQNQCMFPNVERSHQ